MILLILNAIFAGVFVDFARRSAQRAIPFITSGWLSLQAEIRKKQYQHNIESRRAISDASQYLLGGLGWLVIACVCGGLAVYFVLELVGLYLS